MSGLPLRYLLLVAAVAMTGATAFVVAPAPPPPVDAPEAITGSAPRSTAVVTLAPDLVPPDAGVAGDALVDRLVPLEGVAPPETRSATLVFGGDILIHASIRRVSATGADTFDFRPLFEGIRPLVASADLAICHLEVPLTSSNTDLSTYPRFNAPHEVADGIAYAGFDGCSTASNHSMDQGPAGLIDTLDIFDAAGLGHAGTARDVEEAISATIYDLGELEVAHIAATYWLNGLSTPPDQEWMAQRIDVEAILEMAGKARWDGVDLVVVSVHCCTEYRSEPTPEQVEIFEELSRSPWVDLVVGHHSHVVGPIDMNNGKYLLYGLGNLLSGQRQFVGTMDGVLAVATARWADGRWKITDLGVVPTIVDNGDLSIGPAPAGSPSFNRTMNAINGRGLGVRLYQPDGWVAAE